MRIFQYKNFKQWAKDLSLTDSDMLSVIKEIADGLTGNNLDRNVYKKRIKIEGLGRSAGARTIIAYQTEEKHSFSLDRQIQKANSDSKEEQALKRLSKELFGYTNQQIETVLKARELSEIPEAKNNDKQDNRNRPWTSPIANVVRVINKRQIQ